MTEPLVSYRPLQTYKDMDGLACARLVCTDPLCGLWITAPEPMWEKLCATGAVFYCLAGHAQCRQARAPLAPEVQEARDQGFDEGYEEGKAEVAVDWDRVSRLFADARRLTAWVDAHKIEPEEVTVVGVLGQATVIKSVPSGGEPSAGSSGVPPQVAATPEGTGSPGLREQIRRFAACHDEFRPAQVFAAVVGDWSSNRMNQVLTELVAEGKLRHPRHGVYRATPTPEPPLPPEPAPTTAAVTIDVGPVTVSAPAAAAEAEPASTPDGAMWACPKQCGEGPFVSYRLLSHHCSRAHRDIALDEYHRDELRVGSE